MLERHLAPTGGSWTSATPHGAPVRPSARRRRPSAGPDELERWLARATWCGATQPDTLLEPWDWYYAMGAAERRLSRAFPIADWSG
ncbi:MAG: hypothetical protein U0133_06500 [Gemmatimonadales bacterium]